MNTQMHLDAVALQIVLDNLSMMVVIANQDAEIIYSNGSIQNFLHLNDNDIVNNKIGHIFKCLYDSDSGCGNHEHCQSLCDIRRTLADSITTKEMKQASKATIHLKSGDVLYLDLKAIPYSYQDKFYVILILENIQEKLAYEMSKEKTSKIMAMKETSGAIAHELNNPLTVALGQCAFALRDETNLTPALKEKLEKIESQLEKMAAIIKQIDEIVDYKTKAYAQGIDIADLQNK